LFSHCYFDEKAKGLISRRRAALASGTASWVGESSSNSPRYSGRKLLELALIENVQREDLNAIGKPAYKKLIDNIG